MDYIKQNDYILYKDISFTAKDSLSIYYDLYIPKIQKLRGVIQIAHGMVEHKNRYEWLCTNFATHGYIVAINDHRGHGKSIDLHHPFGEMRGINKKCASDLDKSGFYQAIIDIHTLTLLLKYKIIPQIQAYYKDENLSSPIKEYETSLESCATDKHHEVNIAESLYTLDFTQDVSVDTAKWQQAKLPFILLGHSMGSLLSRGYLKLFGNEIDKLILSGSPAHNPLLHFGIKLAQLLQMLGLHTQGKKIINALSFGGFNRSFAKEDPYSEFSTGECAWLSRDKESVQRYRNDEACQFMFSLASFIDLFKGSLWVRYPIKCSDITNKDSHNHALPILIISGESDACGGFGKGVTIIAQDFKEAGYKVSLKLYKDARHEVFFELNKQEVFNDVIAWLQKA